MSSSLKSYKALLFDCYGTLINWEQGMLGQFGPLLNQPNAPTREKLFGVFGPHETRIQTETPSMLYPEVLRQAYLATAADLNLKADDTEATAFGNAVGSWPAFPDSAEALRRLHDSGLKLIILSNVNNASFDQSRQKLEKGYTFDAVYTAENIGSYKPQLRNLDYAISHIKDEFDIDKEDILIVANSKLHDIQPGHKKGLKGAWINRASAVMGVSAFTDIVPDWTYDSMAEFADAITSDRT